MYLYLITTEKEHTEEGGQRVHIPDQDGHLRQKKLEQNKDTADSAFIFLIIFLSVKING